MDDEYYRVRKNHEVDDLGIVVMIKKGKLECLFALDDYFKESGCKLDDGKLRVREGYGVSKVSKEEAYSFENLYKTPETDVGILDGADDGGDE